MSGLISDVALAEQFGISLDRLHKLRRRYHWPHVRLGRQDVRFTSEQVAEIVRLQSAAPVPKSAAAPVVATGQTKRSARRSA